MPDTLAQAFATQGFYWLALTIFAAGLIRGFTGFGSALIFVPVAGLYLPPAQVIGLITLMGVASSAALLPRAWGQADKREISILALATFFFVPVGVAIMAGLDSVVVRWLVALVAAVTLLALVAGWRYHGKLGAFGLSTVGGAAGLTGGLTGMAGPVIILFYLANARNVATVRANIILFLAATDVIILGNLLWYNLLGMPIIVLGLVLAVPYIITTLIGQAAFRVEYGRAYRLLAYGVIALAVVTGLPIWE